MAQEPQATRAPLTVGLFRAGGCTLALPVEAVREVTRLPATLAPVPGAPAGVLGAADVRGMIIPVLDLRAVLGRQPDARAEDVVVILRQFGRLVGLVADSVTGIATIDRATLMAVGSDTPAVSALQTHAFTLAGDAVWLLDPARIAAIPGLPMVEEPSLRAEGARAENRITRLFFASGPFRFAIRATDVDGTVARAPLLQSPLTSSLCHGVIERHGRRIPVVDPLHLLGLGRLAPAADSPVLVLRCRGRDLVGLRIDSVDDMIAQRPGDVAPLPALAVRDPSCFEGVTLDSAAQQHLVLSPEGLREQAQIDAYARLSAMSEVATASRAAGDAIARQQVLVFAAGGRFAAPLLDVHEVIAFPAGVTPIGGDTPHLIGLFDHRGRPVPLVCLARAVGAPAPSGVEPSRVLLVEQGGDMVGFAVETLNGIEPARQVSASMHAPEAATRPSMASLVDIGQDGGQVVPLLDLRALTSALTGRTGPGGDGIATRAAA